MTLCCQIVYFSGSHSINNLYKAAAIRHISIMQMHFSFTMGLRICIKVLNTSRIERTCPSYDSMNCIAFI